jgi:glycosyltransferase involved in cell wall biosynthesis
VTGRRVTFVNRFYAPDHSATSQILTDLAEHLALEGWQVRVVTSRLLYGQSGRLPARETINGVAVLRVRTSGFGNANLLGRAIDYLSFYLGTFVALCAVLQRDELVVAKTDPPLISVVTAVAAAFKDARLVNWLQDLYPEIAFAYGVKAVQSPFGAALTWFRNLTLRSARLNVAICDDMAALLRPSIGAAPVEVIHNWSDDAAVEPVARRDNPLRREWGLEGQFVVGYSGNLGRAHDWRTFVEAAERLRAVRSDVLFLMIGGGAGLNALRAEVEHRALQESFRFKPYQPKAMLNHSLGLPDVHLVSLRRDFRGLLFPSKVFGIAAAGRGILAVVDRPCELASMIEDSGCGEVVAVGDGDGLAAVIGRLAQDPRWVERIGRNAREMLESGYCAQHALTRWRTALAAAAANTRSDPTAAMSTTRPAAR